jgi:uncharacterized membrane protein (UPF0127 family)
MGRLINLRTNETILDDLRIADNFVSRFRGLMGIKSLPNNSGLWITPCNSVHCFFMRIPIDVVFLNKENQVVHISKNMKPWSISPIIRKAKSVVEVNADSLSKVLEIGDQLVFTD